MSFPHTTQTTFRELFIAMLEVCNFGNGVFRQYFNFAFRLGKKDIFQCLHKNPKKKLSRKRKRDKRDFFFLNSTNIVI